MKKFVREHSGTRRLFQILSVFLALCLMLTTVSVQRILADGPGKVSRDMLIPSSVVISEPTALSNVSLPQSQYGSLSWENGSAVPNSYEGSYSVVFKSNGSADLSGVSGYDAGSGTLRGSVLVVVKSLTPAPTATAAPTPEVTQAPQTETPTPEPVQEETSEDKKEDASADQKEDSAKDEEKSEDTDKDSDKGDEDADKDADKDSDVTEDKDSDKDTDKDSDKDADEDSDKDSDKDADKDSDKDADEDSDQDADKDSDKDSDKDADKDSDKDADKDSDKDADKDSDQDADKDSDKDADEDSDQDADKDSDKDADEDSDKDADKDSDADEDSDKDANENSDKDADKEDEDDTTINDITDEDLKEAVAEQPETADPEAVPQDQAQAAASNHTCGGISVSADFLPWYVQFRASSGDSYEFSNEETANIFQSYEFELWNLLEDEPYEIPAGKYVTVTIPVKEGYEYTIEHLLGNGSSETIIPTVYGSTMIFSVDSFSPFGIAGSKPLVGDEIAENGYSGNTPTPKPTSKPSTARPNSSSNSSNSSSAGTSQSSSTGNSDRSYYSSTGSNSNSSSVERTVTYQNRTAKAVQTGDTTAILPYLIMAIVGLVAVAAIIIIVLVMHNRRRQ